MFRKFDINDNAEIPLLKLKNIDGSTISVISHALHIKHRPKLVSYDELEFDVPKYYIEEGKEIKVSYYDSLDTLRQVELEDDGIFVIIPEGTYESGDGIKTIKHVKCNSLEVVFGYRKLANIEGVYPLYDASGEHESILSILLDEFKDWSIDSVDSELWYRNPHDLSKYLCRTYSETDTIWYDFLMNKVSTDFECVFTFDTFNKKIKVQTVENSINKTSIFVNYNNVLKNLKLEPNASGVKCALNVHGSDGLEIDNVNPMGGSTIYDFSYFKNKKWMDESMIESVTKWEDKYKKYQSTFATYVTRMKSYITELSNLNTELEGQEAKLKQTNIALGTKVEAQLKDITISTDKEKKEIATIENEIKLTKDKINNITYWLNIVKSQMSYINNTLKFENNFNDIELEYLNNLFSFCTGDITFDCFVKTDDMTDIEVQNEAQRLYDYGVEKLSQYAKQNYTFSCELINLLSTKQLDEFGKQVELGSEFTFENNGEIFKPILLEYDIDYDNLVNSKCVFSTNIRYDKNSDSFSNLFKDVTNTVNNVSTSIYSWSDSTKATRSLVEESKKDTLDVANKAVISATGMCPTMDGSGLRIRKLLDDGTFDDKQMWMINNNIALTDNNWTTSKMAIGEILVDGRSVYGVCADVIVGNLILGENLVLRDVEGTFDARGNLLQIKDRQGKLKVQLGEYKHNTFGLKLYSDDGKNVVLDETGIVQMYQVNASDNVDSGHPLRFKLFIPSGCKSLTKCMLSFTCDKFRAYSKSAASTTINLKSTEDGGYCSESTEDGGYCSESTDSGGGNYIDTTSGTDDGWQVGVEGHNHGIPDYTELPLFDGQDKNGLLKYGGTVVFRESGDHYHTIDIEIPDHSHTFEIPDHSHTFEIPAHSHDIVMPSHSHTINYGVYETSYYPYNLSVYVNDKYVGGGYSSNSGAIDISPCVKVGQYNDIIISSPVMGKINANVFMQGLFGTNASDVYE